MGVTDRELLELAAKAAGLDVTWKEWRTGQVGKFGCITYTRCEGFWLEGDQWNPLTDDCDALRLAVKLRMDVFTDWNGGANAGNHSVSFDVPEYVYQEGRGLPDPYAATRRAIVRAAAEIGRNK